MLVVTCPRCGIRITTGAGEILGECPTCGAPLPVAGVDAQAEEAVLAAAETIAEAHDDQDALGALVDCFGRALGARAALTAALGPGERRPVVTASWTADPEPGARELLAWLQSEIEAGTLSCDVPRVVSLTGPRSADADPSSPELPWAIAVPVLAGADISGALFAVLERSPDYQGTVVSLAGSFVPLASICLRHAAQTKRLEHLTRFDTLTGCLNRTTILQILDAEYARSARRGHPLAVCFLDLDGFKRVNDAHGHLVGDRVLAFVGEALTTTVREYDSVGRFGGDEFLVVMPETEEDQAVAAAQRLQAAVAAATAEPGGPRLGASYGLATRQGDEGSAHLLAAADERLLAAKRRGKRGRFQDASAGRAV